jgi:precorrin-6A/cobalt-precorrin-6A reductase
MRVLILGGSTEASALARLIAGRQEIGAVLSLAGRTQNPVPSPIPSRAGGFGGVAGLVDYLRRERIEALIDATHPFAAQMSRHAEAACRELDLPRLVLTRLPWSATDKDRWIDVADASAAACALGVQPRRVFLTVGRLSLPAFAAAPQHRYVVRAIDEPEGLAALPDHRLILARPPFRIEDEMRVMSEERIDIVVSKNSGGGASYAKIAAARELGLPVVMIRPPKHIDGAVVYDPRAALEWITRQGRAP